MTLGVTPWQADLFRGTAALCEGRVAPDSIYSILHRECFGLFPDEMFADLFTEVGRRTVPMPTRPAAAVRKKAAAPETRSRVR
jgi:hypothetical protein